MIPEFHNNSYAFDDCSILNMCVIKIPPSYQCFFSKDKLSAKNNSKLNVAIQKLNGNKVPKYRFVPSNIEDNLIKNANQLLEGYNIQILGDTLKAQIIEQLQDYYERIKIEFERITKDKDISKIKELFKNNEKQLTKERNIPEDDDFEIISGYYKHNCKGIRHLISEDEHF